jgi:hypothetical protein
MGFIDLKKIRYNSGEIYTFNNYKIYLIPFEKIAYGISPIIDKFIDRDLNLSDKCRHKGKIKISDKYINSLYKKKDITLFFVTKTLSHQEDVWHNELLNQTLISKIETLDLIKNHNFLNMVRKQLNLRPLMKMIINKNPERYREETISSIREKISSKDYSGGGFVEETIYNEHLISFMFIEKKTELEYYINLVCTTKLFHFDPVKRPEYNFPWGTFLLYLLVKSFGKKSVHLYNDASGKDVIHYHKRFLFNLGKKRCHIEDSIYNSSLEIPYDVMNGPIANKEILEDFIKKLPDNYKTNSGYRMKICNIQNEINIAKINDLERYLQHKWDQTFNDSRISINKSLIKTPTTRLSLNTKKTNNSSKKKTKKKK